jgi:hypothetical protein
VIAWQYQQNQKMSTPISTTYMATIQLYPSNAGGPSKALPREEWQVVLAVAGGKSPAQLTFTGKPAPGEKFVARMELLSTDAAKFFQVGTKFVIWDNGTKGSGVVETLAGGLTS